MPKEEKWLKINGEDKSEEEFCAWISKQVTEHPVVKNFHSKWRELISWEAGDQFSIWDENSRSLKPVDLVLRKAKVVVNMMKPLVETIDSKINFMHSVIGVPNSGETKDLFGSQVATRLLSFNDYVNGFEDKLNRMKYDLLMTGNSCGKWVWDPDVEGGVIAPKISGKPDSSKSADEKGDVMFSVVPIFNVRPDPTANNPEEMRWIIELKEITEQELLRTYPKAEEYLGELAQNDTDKYAGMNVNEDQKDKAEKTYIVREFWEVKSNDYKTGRRIDTCAKRVLQEGENKSPKHRLPYFFLFYKKSPYGFWSWGPLYYVQDLQRHSNRMISMMVEHVESWRPKAFVGKGAIRNASAFTVDPVELVEVDFSRGEPKAFQPPSINPEVPALRDFFIASIDRVSNVHEVSYSRLPQYASRAPASLYQMMLEQES